MATALGCTLLNAPFYIFYPIAIAIKICFTCSNRASSERVASLKAGTMPRYMAPRATKANSRRSPPASRCMTSFRFNPLVRNWPAYLGYFFV